MAEHTREFRGEDLTGARFSDVTLAGSRFWRTDLSRARLRAVDLSGAVIRSADLVDVQITGWIQNVSVNGVDIGPLIDAELDRRHPDRSAMRPEDPAGYRRAWEILERLWGETVERARTLPEEQLHERVDGEWSFIETLRHLLFATDAWVLRTILGQASPWSALDLPHDEMRDRPGVPRDREARPSLEEVLALRAARTAAVRQLVDDLSDDRLQARTEPVEGPGYPDADRYSVADCLSTVLNEEFQHRLYAERDLAALGAAGDLHPSRMP
ncbi:DinB family protein [Jatrophihabitans telluris]|uniref:DinB family protein n=1 Tax=Jatrophihabitans telluris TaxID=2038343 RepID=A0ABY4QZL8_9ACTN|nr:DinB family protein [Jatrophihabitans telluris]UQX88657.1 DinB family protein [Jatrophihabitans telluris]